MTEPTFEEREARRKLLTEIRPSAAKEYYSGSAFEADYKSAHVVRTDAIPDVQKKLRLFFCPCCQKQVPNTDLTEVHVAYAQYDEDPLRNYSALVTLRCFGCGWNEIIPVSGPPDLTAEQQEELLEIDVAKRQMELQRIRAMQGQQQGLLGSSAWANDAMRAYQKQATFGQMYGAGSQVLKNLIKPGQVISVKAPEFSSPSSGQALADSIWAAWEARDVTMQALEQAQKERKALDVRAMYEIELQKELARKFHENMKKATMPTPSIMPKLGPPPKPSDSPPEYVGLIHKVKAFFK